MDHLNLEVADLLEENLAETVIDTYVDTLVTYVKLVEEVIESGKSLSETEINDILNYLGGTVEFLLKMELWPLYDKVIQIFLYFSEK